MYVGVLVTGDRVDDASVDANVSAGKLGEGDGVASARITEGEQAVMKKRKITIKNLFNLYLLNQSGSSLARDRRATTSSSSHSFVSVKPSLWYRCFAVLSGEYESA